MWHFVRFAIPFYRILLCRSAGFSVPIYWPTDSSGDSILISAVIWSCVDTLNKTISAIPNKAFVINRLRVLPILTDMLEISTQLTTIDCILKMLEQITYGVEIAVVEPFLEKLLQLIVKIIIEQNSSVNIQIDSKPQYNEVIKQMQFH